MIKINSLKQKTVNTILLKLLYKNKNESTKQSNFEERNDNDQNENNDNVKLLKQHILHIKEISFPKINKGKTILHQFKNFHTETKNVMITQKNIC